MREAALYASPLLLYAEEIEPHSGRHLGNFPQAFAHLALINAVMHIIRADQSLTEGEILTEAPGLLAVQFGLELDGLELEPADAAPHPNASGDDAGRDAWRVELGSCGLLERGMNGVRRGKGARTTVPTKDGRRAGTCWTVVSPIPETSQL